MKLIGKRLLKAVCFFALLVLVTHGAYETLRWKNSGGITKFYQYPKNTVDVAFLGSSHCYCTVNTALLWEDYGMAACNMGESGQTIASTYCYMKELLKTQKPKVTAVELSYLNTAVGGLKNGNLYRNTLNMRWSRNYLDNVMYAAQSDEVTGEYIKYLLLKFPVFHGRYNQLTEQDFHREDVTVGRYKGSWAVDTSLKTPKAAAITDSAENLDTRWLDALTELADSHGTKLVFFVAPYMLNKKTMRTFNAVKAYARERQIPFFNFNEIYEEAGIDYSSDLRERSHLNNYGARKVTSYLGAFLHENYDLPDRRGDADYRLYEEIRQNWELYVTNHAVEEETELSAYLSLLSGGGYPFAVLAFDRSVELDGILGSGGSWYESGMADGGEYFTAAAVRRGRAVLSENVLFQDGQLYIDQMPQKRKTSDKSALWVVSVNPLDEKLLELAQFAWQDGEYRKTGSIRGESGNTDD